jgi:hypothetical protein
LEDRRNVGESSCNSGDGTDQRVQSPMFIMMITIKKPVPLPVYPPVLTWSEVLFYPVFPDFPTSIVSLEGSQLRPFLLMVREVCGRRWVWNVGGKVYWQGRTERNTASNSGSPQRETGN